MSNDYLFVAGTRDGVIRIFDSRDSVKCVNEVIFFIGNKLKLKLVCCTLRKNEFSKFLLG